VPDTVLTLQQAADELGVHYMTAYRYVRLGQLDAHKVGGGWRVTPESLTAFREGRSDEPARHRHAPWSDRLESRLIAGDAAGAWGVIEAAMAGGSSVAAVYLDMLAPALRSIGAQWEAGEIDIAIEHRASGIAGRLIGRLGSRCVRRGRSRGTVILGGPVGERHSLVIAILGDLLRLERYSVSDLGSDTPPSSFVLAATTTDDLVAIGLSVTHPDNLEEGAATCAALRAADLSAPVILGGQAVRDLEHARSLGGDAYAPDAAGMVALLDELSGAPSPSVSPSG
jgi:excisionase family DNA binding protein